MTWAISIKSTDHSAEKILDLWHMVSSLEEYPSMLDLGYPPHFTFALYENIDLEELKQATRMVFANRQVIEIHFGQIRYFDEEELVLWLQPLDTATLHEIHFEIHNSIDQIYCHKYYRTGSWIPHCTLGVKIKPENVDQAKRLANSKLEDFKVAFNIADCIQFPPIQIIDQYKLK